MARGETRGVDLALYGALHRRDHTRLRSLLHRTTGRCPPSRNQGDRSAEHHQDRQSEQFSAELAPYAQHISDATAHDRLARANPTLGAATVTLCE